MQVLVKAAHGHVFVYKHTLALLRTEADQVHKVPVMQPRQQFNLPNELNVALLANLVQTLDSYNSAVLKNGLVDSAISAFANGLIEIVCRPLQLIERECSNGLCVIGWKQGASQNVNQNSTNQKSAALMFLVYWLSFSAQDFIRQQEDII